MLFGPKPTETLPRLENKDIFWRFYSQPTAEQRSAGEMVESYRVQARPILHVLSDQRMRTLHQYFTKIVNPILFSIGIKGFFTSDEVLVLAATAFNFSVRYISEHVVSLILECEGLESVYNCIFAASFFIAMKIETDEVLPIG